MQVSYVANGEPRSGRLTTDHKVATYRQAVLVSDDDKTLFVQVDDVDYIVVPKEPTESERIILRGAADFGYKLQQNGADWTPPPGAVADYIN